MLVLIDTLNIIFMNFHMACKMLHDKGETLTEENKGFLFHFIINKINEIFMTYQNPIFCLEGRKSKAWRKSIYSGYKENRKRLSESEEHVLMIRHLNEIIDVIRNYPCKVIEHEMAEADDVIFALAEKYKKVIIISTDKDLIQIKNRNPEAEVYNPIKKKFVEAIPTIIEEKSICGDPSDNIPGIYRVGPKILQKMLSSKEEWNKIMKKGNNQAVYESFRKIVDLSCFPSKITKEIQDLEESMEVGSFRPDHIEKFFWDNKLKDLMARWPQVKNEIFNVSNGNFFYSVEAEEVIEEENKDEEIDTILKEFF